MQVHEHMDTASHWYKMIILVLYMKWKRKKQLMHEGRDDDRVLEGWEGMANMCILQCAVSELV
jgi:hypothetical protein